MGIRIGRSPRRKDRMRRKKNKPVSLRRGKVNQISSLPPVMVRGMNGGAAVGNTKAFNKQRRRIDVPLSAPGAEVRLPSIPRFNAGWRLLSFLLVCLCAFALYQAWEMDTYRVNKVEVNGLANLTNRDLNTFLGISGEPIFTIDPTAIEQEISSSFSELSSVSASVEMPNTVAITVTERVPVLIWNIEGISLLIDQNGAVFPARNELYELSQYPVVEAQESPAGLINRNSISLLSEEYDSAVLNRQIPSGDPGVSEVDQNISPEMVSAVLTLHEYAPEGAALKYDTLHGFAWKDRRGWDVYFGEADAIEMKVRVYKAIFNKLKNEELKPEFISVEFVHNPYYRLAE